MAYQPETTVPAIAWLPAVGHRAPSFPAAYAPTQDSPTLKPTAHIQLRQPHPINQQHEI